MTYNRAKLSPNFTYKELVRSDTASRLKIPNTPNEKQLINLILLTSNVLQPLRLKANAPIRINSGFRSKTLNRKIGGAATSQHCKGEAADLTLKDPKENRRLFYLIEQYLPYDQLIWELGDDNSPAWIHVSYKGDGRRNRKEILRCCKQNGKRIYAKFFQHNA